MDSWQTYTAVNMVILVAAPLIAGGISKAMPSIVEWVRLRIKAAILWVLK